MSGKKPETASKEAPKADDTTTKYWYPNKNPDLKEVQLGFKGWHHLASDLAWVVVPPVILLYAILAYTSKGSLVELYNNLVEATRHMVKQHPNNAPEYLLLAVLISVFVAVVLLTSLYFTRKRPVYLVDFATFQPPDELKITIPWFCERTAKVPGFTQESIDFQVKLAPRTGLGDETYFPEGIKAVPFDLSMQKAREEAEMVLSGCMDELFAKTGLKPHQIDILIVNCSLFNPTPSLSAMMINKYKMRSNIKSYNLSGMGCSAGVISIDLAKDLLQAHRNSIAIVLSTENITQNWYFGNEKNKLVQNTLFRVGGAGIVLTNKRNMHAKYQLKCTVRVTKAANDAAYKAVWQEEDAAGLKGVALVPGRDLMVVVGDALKTNMSMLGPIVLPWSEQIKFGLNLCAKKLFPHKKIPTYIPDFKKAFQHFCIHAGGRAVIDGMEQNLGLSPYDVEPSRATLYRYGNTSSSSIWYELNFIEKCHGVKKGDNVWQIAFGSGFKCNSAVWVAQRTIAK